MTASRARDVLIVGAGPTGLAAALGLARHGWYPRLIDQLPGPTPFSRAIGVNPRTLELLAPFGLDRTLIEAGNVLPRLQLRAHGRLVATVDFTRLHHRFPHLLALAQSKTELFMRERLRVDGVSPEWGVELLDFDQDAEGVSCRLRNGDQLTDVRIAYLVGADGSHSTVRSRLGTPMPGHTYPDAWTLADLRGDWPFEREAVQLMAQPGRAVLAFPFEQDLVRVVASSGDVLAQLPPGCTVREVVWQSSFRISERLAASYRKGRVLLAGDAAHLHSPVGARGMNLGIEDGLVLADKLIAGDLESYQAERRTQAARVVRLTRFQTRLVTTASLPLRLLRDTLISRAVTHPGVRDLILREVSGLRSTSRRH